MFIPRWIARLARRWTRGRLLGDRGERTAARYLKRQGMRILARGHRSPLGEIDLIALDGTTVVFVEVKSRRTHAAGRPEDAVHRAKQRQVTRLALEYLKRRGWLGRRAARFDVLAITWPDSESEPAIQHFRNAFEPTGVDGMFS